MTKDLNALAPIAARASEPGRAARRYLDANAAEALRPEARAAAWRALDLPGNPASAHRAGRDARRLLEDSRDRIALLLDTTPDRVILTSGGTEADALAVHGLGAGRRLLVGATEHPAILAARDPGSVSLPVHADGTLVLEALARALAASPVPALVCAMAANNETGVLHPLDAILSLCRAHGALLHVDAAQVAGRMPIPDAVLRADGVALSAHKQGGLAGAGALVLGRGVELDRVLIPGGGQELGRRGGTPALAAIAAFAAVARPADPSDASRLARLRDRIEAACVSSGAVALGAAAPRLPNTTCLALPGRAVAAQLIALDLAGYEVSAGSACSSGRIGGSHVLEAMGAGRLAGEAIRVSLPWNAEEADADGFVAAWRAMASRDAAWRAMASREAASGRGAA